MKPANKIFKSSGLAVATILFATFAAVVPASGQYKPTGADGITASPKARAQLNERKAPTTLVSATAPAMGCPKCKDAWVAQADPSAKGGRVLMGQTTKLVARHLCEGCGADITTTGVGKSKQAVAAHNCTGCGSENLACCGPKGMDDHKIQVAPLK
jgi:hypothetical protein